ATMVYLKMLPPRTSPLSPYVNVVLKGGSTGTAVKALQKAIGKLTVDGSFGLATETRVKEFQKAKGLTVNGVVDGKVWATLMGAVTAPAPAPAPTAPAPAPTTRAPAPAATSPLAKYAGLTLKLWSKGDAVKALQKAIGG